MTATWLRDPVTGGPMAAIPGEPPRRYSEAAHWSIERDDYGTPVRMRFVPCDGPCCAGEPVSDAGGEVCDSETGCQEESDFEPTASLARQTASRSGWHFRRLGRERWYCPDHTEEWRAATSADIEGSGK